MNTSTKKNAEPSPQSNHELSRKLPLFYAGSLSGAFAKINAEFKGLHPDVELVSEPAGSVTAIRRITEQNRECGVVASADYRLIPQLMFPNYADWYINFASEEIVLTYSEKSKYQDQINASNWFEILQREDVKFGRSDPDQDPGGYRTLLVWQLAEKYYNVPGFYQKLLNAKGDIVMGGNVRPGDIDYNFSYKAPAVQNNRKIITLPEEINLSTKRFENYYAQAKVELKGSKSGETLTVIGEPILFGLTIPKNYPNQELAVSWVGFLLSSEGVAIMKNAGWTSIRPAITNDINKVPKALISRVK
ncbi:MAG: molybdate/tungstate transport system substrate-binding protein [Thermoproteota archaeon]|nr:molybdate/tungstate transport system substrate-binding protein [Thermoproteota archaeon]